MKVPSLISQSHFEHAVRYPPVREEACFHGSSMDRDKKCRGTVLEPARHIEMFDMVSNSFFASLIQMKIEHLAYQAEDPVAVAQWYVAHLRCLVKRSSGPPGYAHFLADSAGSVMLEIYNHPRLKTPDYRNMDSLLLHLAFWSENPAVDRDRLVSAGATVEEELTTNAAGDILVMLRDPWSSPSNWSAGQHRCYEACPSRIAGNNSILKLAGSQEA